MCLYTLILVSLATFTAEGHTPSPPVVDTVHGKVLGKYVSLEGFAQPVAVFLGVPFAKPPLGSLRFAPPQPPEPWNFVKNATSYPPMCSQDPVTGQIVNDLLTNRKENIPLQFSEDCLYLNIYTPSDLTRSDRLPVMVWIHGGGLVLGGASTYDGLALSTHENVVVVAIQYRLGIWGFFSTGDEHSWGNWGHLDQVAALSWVQDNIANFGGDPGSVTIFGESAGGESVSVLVLSPLAKNLFHRAISESGVALTAGLVKKNTRPLAEVNSMLGSSWLLNTASVLSSQNLFKMDLHEDTRQSHPFIPTVIDGVLLPKMPEEILAEKNFNTVPYIVGINKQEFGWILCFFPNLFAIKKYLGDTEDPDRNKHQLLELIGDVAFGVPSVIVSRGHRDAGAPTYVYEFQYRPSFSPEMKPKTVIGDHGDEVYSVFGAPILRDGTSEEEINLSKTVMKFWANFARNGNPNGKGMPHWPKYDQKEGYLQIGATIQQAQRLKDKEVAFWTELLAKKPPLTGHTEL
uniref:Carboxylic ester hydrolase n=1 Tax=Cricetulus griseus TaxID=10029 RepID=A0A8C2MK38_CRIGR